MTRGDEVSLILRPQGSEIPLQHTSRPNRRIGVSGIPLGALLEMARIQLSPMLEGSENLCSRASITFAPVTAQQSEGPQ